jgi:hypothetical protein
MARARASTLPLIFEGVVMKSPNPVLTTAVFVTLCCQVAQASTVNSPGNYFWSNHILGIALSSPPALMYVEDSFGNLDGADPTKGLDKFGRGTSIQDIPSSYVDQDNLFSDDVNGEFIQNNVTAWTINILDQPAASYVVNLLGISAGVWKLSRS